MKKRIFFNKSEDMRFISHLDLLRFFERLMIKANIPVKYSQGFHPRPKISFGNPISLGTEAFNEVMELDLERDIDNETLLENFNSLDIKGFKVLKVEDFEDKTSIVERFNTAIYEITGTKEEIDSLEALLSQDTIIETKEKKGNVVERDLKQKIDSFERVSDTMLVFNLSNGSPNSYLDMAGLDTSSLKIRKMGYKI